MPPGILDNPPRAIYFKALIDFAGDFLRCEILSVIDHALDQDASVLDHPLPGNTAWHTLYVRRSTSGHWLQSIIAASSVAI
jgi:hypothetical protein